MMSVCIERLAYAADFLHVSQDTLRRMATLGKLPGAFKVGQKWLLHPEVFHQWLIKQATLTEVFTAEPEVPSGKFVTSGQTVEKYESLLAQKTRKKLKPY